MASRAKRPGRTTGSSSVSTTHNPLKITSKKASDLLHESALADLSQYSQSNESRNSNWILYFILPEGSTEATCSPNLASTFVLVEEAGLMCQWMNESDCLKYSPEYGNIFVVDPFEGPAFDHVCAFRTPKNIGVYGPQVIRFAMQDMAKPAIGKTDNPPFTMGMRNMLISLTGIDSKTKKQLIDRIQLMCGEVTLSFTKGVTHVVADNMLTDKVFAAYGKNTPVMTVEWVEAVWRDSQQSLVHATNAQYAKFTCPIFHKLVICVSQVTPALKSALRNAIEQHGGKYTADLVKNKTSVLIVPKAGGEKHRYAEQWKLPCVVPDWIEASKSAGHVLPVKNFEVEVKMSTPKNSMVAPPGIDLVNNSIVSNVGVLNSRNAPYGTFAVTDNECSNFDVAEILKRTATNEPYLDGCRIYVCGMQKFEDVRRLVNASGALRLSCINQKVTHVIVTEKKISDSELEDIKRQDPRPYVVTVQWLIESAEQGNQAPEELFKYNIDSYSINSSKHDVVPESTYSEENSDHQQLSISDLVDRKCANQTKNSGNSKSSSSQSSQSRRERCDQIEDNVHENEFEVAPLGRNSSQTLQRQTSIVNPYRYEDNVEQPVNFDVIGVEYGVPQQHPCNNSTPAPEAEDTFGYGSHEHNNSDIFPFAGLKFKVMIDDISEKAEVEHFIRNYRGKISNNSYNTLILPPIYPEDLSLKPSITCFTRYWLTSCIEKEVLCPAGVSYWHQPLPGFEGMLNLLPDVVVAISQYSDHEKEYLSILITALGGMCQQVFAKRGTTKNNKGGQAVILPSTHLIVSTTDNDKFRAAKKWGLPAVTAQWLIDCYKTKTVLDTDPYCPTASINESDPAVSYLLTTPKTFGKKRLGKTGNSAATATATTSVAQFPATVERNKIRPFAPMDPPPPLRTPPPASSKTIAKGKADNTPEGTSLSGDDSFLAWRAANPNIPDVDFRTDSFLEWYAEYKGPEKTPSPLIPGFTRSASRKLRKAFEVMGANSPFDAGIPLYPRNTTPIDEMMLRDWEKIEEAHEKIRPLKAKLQIKKIPDFQFQPKEEVQNDSALRDENSTKPRTSSKRSSDSSLEEEDVEKRRIDFAAKRLRLSSESDPEDQELRVNGDDNKSNRSLKETAAASTSIHSHRSPNQTYNAVNVADEDGRDLRQGTKLACGSTSTPQHMPSIQTLKNLLADDNEETPNERYFKPQFSSTQNNTYKSLKMNNLQHVQDKPSAEEIDTPPVVWVAEDDVKKRQKPKEPTTTPSVGNEKITTRATRSKAVRSTDPTTSSTLDMETEQRRKIVSEDNLQAKPSAKIKATSKPSKSSDRPLFKVPDHPAFMLSGHDEATKEIVEAEIETLGGSVLHALSFDMSVFAIIATTVARSEKVLCCIASGKPLLKPGYITKCIEANKFLPIEDAFLWKESDANPTKPVEQEIAKAACTWFRRCQHNPMNRPFKDKKFYLMESQANKEAAYVRLITAGAGQIVQSPEEADLILCDKKDAAPQCGVPILLFTYLSQTILRVRVNDTP